MTPHNDDGRHTDTLSRRVLFLRIFFIALFVLYGMQLFNMQILSGEQYRTRAQDISRRTTVLPSQRGGIFDRTYTRAFASNIDSFAVSIVPAEVPRGDMPALFSDVAEILGIPVADIQARVPPSLFRLFQPVEIASNVPFETIAALAERKDSLPGVTWNSKPVRNYVNPGSLAHILGYVGDITREELIHMRNLGYKPGDVIGKSGIERQYDEILRGREGRETKTVDVRGRKVSSREYIPPEMGNDLVLTIDSRIQTLAERALGERIGSVVVKRPATGEILAMVSYPWYDPNIFTQRERGGVQALFNDPNRPLINRAIQSSYPPGSTFKIVMTTAILAENAFPPDRTVVCPGEIDYGNRLWRCHIRRPGHGRMNLFWAMAQSCNIYYWQVGRDNLGVERIVSYSNEFGFGSFTGIDLPGEVSGFVPTPQWKMRRFHERWVHGDTMNMSIGQGFLLTTPLQLANMVSMTVNDGIIYRPHVLKEVRNPVTGEVVRSIRPSVLHQSYIAPEVFEVVRRDMRGVITDGTARFPMNIRAVEIAGKTGTAEIGAAQDGQHAWFAAYAPYRTDNPEERVVVSVIVEASNPWEWWAVYASAIIFQGIFADQNFEEAVRSLGFQHLPGLRSRGE